MHVSVSSSDFKLFATTLAIPNLVSGSLRSILFFQLFIHFSRERIGNASDRKRKRLILSMA